MLDLLDYRRQVAALYTAIRINSAPDHEATCEAFRRARDTLFRTHPQSALDDVQKARFRGLEYYAYDVAYRVEVTINTDIEHRKYRAELGPDGILEYRKFGEVTVNLPGGTGTLAVYWLSCYGGGLFLPFRDGTNNQTTYGGGRYLLDTVKGADLGGEDGRLVLDFNYAYHPSCAYNSHWVCPLAPGENTLAFPVLAGERLEIELNS